MLVQLSLCSSWCWSLSVCQHVGLCSEGSHWDWPGSEEHACSANRDIHSVHPFAQQGPARKDALGLNLTENNWFIEKKEKKKEIKLCRSALQKLLDLAIYVPHSTFLQCVSTEEKSLAEVVVEREWRRVISSDFYFLQQNSIVQNQMWKLSSFCVCLLSLTGFACDLETESN